MFFSTNKQDGNDVISYDIVYISYLKKHPIYTYIYRMLFEVCIF